MKIDVCELWGKMVVFCGKFDLGYLKCDKWNRAKNSFEIFSFAKRNQGLQVLIAVFNNELKKNHFYF